MLVLLVWVKFPEVHGGRHLYLSNRLAIPSRISTFTAVKVARESAVAGCERSVGVAHEHVAAYAHLSVVAALSAVVVVASRADPGLRLNPAHDAITCQQETPSTKAAAARTAR